MCALANPVASPAVDALHAQFQTLLPRIETHARIYFRGVRCAETREDCVAEAVALAWRWFVELTKRGKDPAEFVSTLATFAARAVRSGRRLAGQECAKDVLSPTAQRRHGFVVEILPVSTRCSFEDVYTRPDGQREMDALEERLRDDTQTPVPDQAAFRIDWPDYFQTLSRRDQRLAEFLALGHSGKRAAAQFRMTPGRVTQLRKEWCREWYARHGEEAPFERRARSARAT